MRVASVNQDPGIVEGGKKGAAVHLAAMRQAFLRAGAEVVALDQCDDDALASALAEAHRRDPFDLVYERYALGKVEASGFAHEHGLAHVLEVNAPLAEEEARYRAPVDAERMRALEEPVFRRAARVLAVSREVARYAIARGADPSRVRVTRNGVDAQLFRPRGDLDPVRRALVPAGRFALGFHGRLRPWHGFDRLVDASVALLERGVPIQLVLVGEGDFESLLDGRVPREFVTRVPWVEHAEVGRYVASFDALPLTYRPDAPCYFSPLKLAEAMACGVVPIVPSLGDLAESVTAGVDALLYDPGDLQELVGVVETLVRRPSWFQALSAGAARSARGRTWDSIALWALGLCAEPARGSLR